MRLERRLIWLSWRAGWLRLDRRMAKLESWVAKLERRIAKVQSWVAKLERMRLSN